MYIGAALLLYTCCCQNGGYVNLATGVATSVAATTITEDHSK